MTPAMRDRLTTAGVVIGAVGLLYMIMRPSQAPISGETIPELLGSSGPTGTPVIQPPATYNVTPGQITIGDTGQAPLPYTPKPFNPFNISALINAMSNPAGGGCCNGTNGSVYGAGSPVPIAQVLPTPIVSPTQSQPYPTPSVVGTYAEYNGDIQMNFALMSDGSTRLISEQILPLLTG